MKIFKIDYITIIKRMLSNLFSSTVIHERYKPFKNKFKYNVLSMLIDYDELKSLSNDLFFFSYNRFNLFSFYEKDHGYRDGKYLKEYVSNFLKKNKIIYKDLKIRILCFPRILGYVFNPLSVIFCFDNENLVAIFYEVKNTPNEQHTYCFATNNKIIKTTFQHSCKKSFYVSPFINMRCKYQFFTKIPKDKFSIIIKVFDYSKNKILFASQTGKKIKFNSLSLIKQLFKNPFIMYKVFFFILYQSIVIILKGGKYYSRKKKVLDSISFEGSL